MKVKESDAFVGQSTLIASVREEIRLAAGSDAKVLITGESGVGKEVVARLVHAQSARRSSAFVALNCAVVPEGLLESELFGHARGSFTGAFREHIGLLEQANRGTFFMDEVGEMSVRMQALLLRFLETGEIQRVGSQGPQSLVDARIIAATNRDLLKDVHTSTFRKDLYYRLNVIHIRIAPLRDRREDIPALLDHFLTVYSAHYQVPHPQLSAEVEAQLMAHDWPGNVRELRNVVERLIVRRPGQAITPDYAKAALNLEPRSASVPAGATALTVDTADMLFQRIVKDGVSFWDAVYEPFMARDITRGDLRRVISRGLEQTQGNCKRLVRLFNMDLGDYKRFLNFLNKHDCHLRFQQPRTGGPETASRGIA